MSISLKAGGYLPLQRKSARTFVRADCRICRDTISLVKYKIADRRATKVLGPKPATDREAAELGWPDPDN
jgi:hypothetical protein